MSALAEVVAAAGPAARGLRRSEYERLVSDGILADQRVELLGGVLLEVSPQDAKHADAVDWLHREVGRQLPPPLQCRAQMPFALADDGEPEPDLAVVANRRYGDAHPAEASLLVEVARTSHRLDLGLKARQYAAAGIPEYWVVDLPGRAVIQLTQPRPSGYAARHEQRTGLLASVAVPGLAVDLDALFGS